MYEAHVARGAELRRVSCLNTEARRETGVMTSHNFPGEPWLYWYTNVSILDFTVAKRDGGGGDNWRCTTCKAAVKSSL